MQRRTKLFTLQAEDVYLDPRQRCITLRDRPELPLGPYDSSSVISMTELTRQIPIQHWRDGEEDIFIAVDDQLDRLVHFLMQPDLNKLKGANRRLFCELEEERGRRARFRALPWWCRAWRAIRREI